MKYFIVLIMFFLASCSGSVFVNKPKRQTTPFINAKEAEWEAKMHLKTLIKEYFFDEKILKKGKWINWLDKNIKQLKGKPEISLKKDREFNNCWRFEYELGKKYKPNRYIFTNTKKHYSIY